MVRHTYVDVNSDDQKKEDFEGTLADYAAYILSHRMRSELSISERNIINIESHFYTQEIRPSQCNSSTWYTRSCARLSIWYWT